MKFSVPFPVTIFALGVALVLVSALALRAAPTIPASLPSELAPLAVASSTIPAFTSASFVDGDTLRGLGPEWTILDQQSSVASATGTVSGLRPTRVTTIKRIGSDLSLNVTDEIIVDATIVARENRSHQLVTIGGRQGYVVGSGFLLIGERDALFIADRSGVWPTNPSDDVVSYIATVRVP